MSFIIIFFFFKQKTAYEMRISDWSSGVCSSDLAVEDIGDVSLRRIGNRARLLGVIALVIGGDGDEAVGQAEIVELIDGRQPGAERLRHAFGDIVDRDEEVAVGLQVEPEPAFASCVRAQIIDPQADRQRRSEEHTSELQSLMRISY